MSTACNKCGEDDRYLPKAGRNIGECKACARNYYERNKSKIIAKSAEWKKSNPEAVRESNSKSRKNLDKTKTNESARIRYHNNIESYRTKSRNNARNLRLQDPEKVRAQKKFWAESNPKSVMVTAAKKRAKDQNLPFDLTPEDFEIPEVCPVFGTPLSKGEGGWSASSPSLDKTIPHLGYVRGNVRVISWRANCLKRDATPEEIRMLNDYMQKTKPGVL